MDISDGAIARYHEDSETIVGITLIALRQRVLQELNRKLHVTPHPNGWAVTEENVESSQKVFYLQYGFISQ